MAQHELQQFITILKNNGLQVTKARQTVFNLLLSSEPQAMSELLAKAHGQVDRVSVYRNIELFEKLGIVHRIYIGWKYKIELSDDFTDHHHHLSCLQCGTTIDIADESHINEFIAKVAADAGFKPRRHQFEVDGYCSNCQ